MYVTDMWGARIITKDWQGAVDVNILQNSIYIMDFHFRGNDYGHFSFPGCLEALKFIFKTLGNIPSG